MTEGSDPRFPLLKLEALMAYSDACTLPTLTPSCPYFSLKEAGPRCGEECRDVLTSLGVDRAARDVEVGGGLVMTGRALPLRVATGYEPFDATRQLLLEASLPIAQRSTATLLLQLRGHATTAPEGRIDPDSYFFDIWEELSRRTLPVDKVLRAAVAPAIASSILRLLRADKAYALPQWQNAYLVCKTLGPGDAEAYDTWFVVRAAEWLTRILEGDSRGFLSWSAPPPSLVANMPARLHETEGQWLWDRFTRGALDEWSTSSLVMEWRYLRGKMSLGLSPRLLAARVLDISRVSDFALERMANGIEQTQATARDLSSDHFVTQALTLLKAGQAEKAAEIFSALAVVNPADGDALNNLGFCLLPSDPQTALRVLDRASTFHLKRPAINVANRAFTRHLLGQNVEAITLIESARLKEEVGPVWMWSEDRCTEFHLEAFDSLQAYTSSLQQHIEETLSTQA
jgi:hypothetical protein